ncbi:hypothetical protein F5B19DRAFT_384483 [Rostrohypoxylon terebratum]|nr:hypothetical protein F5B19DRAFT_384483 [Rostrohypoxylon terebratum]
MPTDPVVKDGFEFSNGKFRTVPGHTERVEVHILRNAFLPRLTPEARTYLNNHRDFVADQLRHYGIDYDKGELVGYGTNLMKKLLGEGKLDRVPDRIEKLKSQLAVQWYNQLTLKEMAESHQEKLIEMYFLDDSGLPDRSKTTNVLTVPLPRESDYRAGKLITAAKSVAGLHYMRLEDTLYIGWDRGAVKDLARGHWGRVEQEKKEAQRRKEKEKRNRERRREAKHTAYLQKARKSNRERRCSPVGSYIINCSTIETGYLDNPNHEMKLRICQPDVHGCFHASFDFGVIEGMMILSDQQSTLNEYCTWLENEAMPGHGEYWDEDEGEDEYEDEDEDEDEETYGHQPATNAKRKTAFADYASYKSMKGPGEQSRKLFFKWKGRETETGMVLYQAKKGSIIFDDAEFSTFTGKIKVEFVEKTVLFSARKISGIGRPCGSWNDYSEAAYEWGRVGRWN